MTKKSIFKKHFEETQTCWEFMKCPKETRKKCEIYTLNWGEECWVLASDPIVNGYYFSKKYGNCTNCPWFKKNNS